MKRTLCILLLAALPLLLSATGDGKAYSIDAVPNTYAQNRLHHVSDPTGILSTESTDEINRILSLLEDSTGIQSMVVMLPGIGNEDVFDFAHNLFRHWGIGGSERNDGLLILYVGDQHAIRFTTGYGLEGTLPDAICKRIQQRHMLPHFREGNTDRGMVEGVSAVAQVLDGTMTPDNNDDGPELWAVALVALIMSIIVGIIIWLIDRQAHTCPKCGKAGTLKSVSAVPYRDALLRKHVRQTLRCTNCGHTVERDRIIDDINSMGGGAMLGGGRSGGGGFSGGFFGGGSTGGGGATSRW